MTDQLPFREPLLSISCMKKGSDLFPGPTPLPASAPPPEMYSFQPNTLTVRLHCM